jgi:hypothetical protein
MLCRAPHIVQLFLMADNPITAALPGTRRSARIREIGNRVDVNQDNYLLMEYCSYGTLQSQLLKAAIDMPPNDTERWLPEWVLWRIFDCLLKGCMAMECPPRYNPRNAPPAAPGAAPAPLPLPASQTAGILREEDAPGAGQGAGHYGIVHGDLVRRVLHHFKISVNIFFGCVKNSSHSICWLVL